MRITIAFNVQGPLELRAAVEALVLLNRAELRLGAPRLQETSVRYRREETPEEFRTISECVRHGFGDCEDLAAWLVAQAQEAGIDAWVGIVEDPGGGGLHAVCRLPDGRIIDPSARRGMLQ